MGLSLDQDSSRIFQDNVRYVEWAIGGATKHFSKRIRIDTKHNYGMSIVGSGVIKLATVQTIDMIADVLTYLLTSREMNRVNDVMNNFD